MQIGVVDGTSASGAVTKFWDTHWGVLRWRQVRSADGGRNCCLNRSVSRSVCANVLVDLGVDACVRMLAMGSRIRTPPRPRHTRTARHSREDGGPSNVAADNDGVGDVDRDGSDVGIHLKYRCAWATGWG